MPRGQLKLVEYDSRHGFLMSQLLPVWLSMGEIYMFAILNAFHEMIRHEKSFIFDTKQTLICKFRYFFFCLNSGKQLTLSLTSIIEGHACQVQLSLSSSEKPILFRIQLRRWRKLSFSLNGRIQTKTPCSTVDYTIEWEGSKSLCGGFLLKALQ